MEVTPLSNDVEFTFVGDLEFKPNYQEKIVERMINSPITLCVHGGDLCGLEIYPEPPFTIDNQTVEAIICNCNKCKLLH